MFKCDCCQPPKTYKIKKSLYRHQRKIGVAVKTDSAYLAEQKRIEYEQSPNICVNCSKSIPFEDRFVKIKFCSSSCSATHTNKARLSSIEKRSTGTYRLRPIVDCPNCGAKTKGKYCSRSCDHQHRRRQKDLEIESGKCSQNKTIRRYLIRKHGHSCQVCSTSEWNCQPVALELDHIDGNHQNNLISNLRLICPNCHAQTGTYKGRNKGNGRHKRMVRYYEGRSF